MTASARGLFRATGKVAKVELPREAADFYPTPPEPTRALLRAEEDRLRQFPVIWEPACGDGAMAREMTLAGHTVLATDKFARGFGTQRDFFDTHPNQPREHPLRAIVTNPPYNEVNWRDGRGRWIRHALEVLGVEYMALLLSWSWPGAGGHAPLWAEHPPARVYLMRWKIDFTGQGAPPMLNGWFVWDREHQGETVLRMLDKPGGIWS